jgi:hypothetical protein
MAAAPESGSAPLIPAYGLVVPVSVTHSLSMISRSCLRPGHRPGAWRAEGAPLKVVRKVVTVPDRLRVRGV